MRKFLFWQIVLHVFISHMDFDHASGLRLIKDAKDIRCSREEWTACIGVFVNLDPTVKEQTLEVQL